MKWLKTGWESIPIYVFGIVFLIKALVSGLRTPAQYLSALILALTLSVGIYALLRGKFRNKTKDANSKTTEEPVKKTEEKPAEDPFVVQGREQLRELETLNEAIPDPEISARLKQMTLLAENLLEIVRENPEKKAGIRQIIQYYLPTVIKLLHQYTKLQEQENPGENIRTSMERIRGILADVNLALQKQTDKLFAADVVDITAEIRVMEKKLAAEGLAEE